MRTQTLRKAALICVVAFCVLLTAAASAHAQDEGESCDIDGVRIGFQGTVCGSGQFWVTLNGVTANGTNTKCLLVPGGNIEFTSSNKAFVKLKPNQKYIMEAGDDICVTVVNFDVPKGYILEVDGKETTNVTKTVGGLQGTGDGTWEVVLRKKCPCGNEDPGAAGPDVSSVIWQAGMGKLSDVQLSGHISVREKTLSSSIYTPSVLIYSPPINTTEVDVVKDGDTLRQIKAPQALADIVVINSSEYDIRYYRPADITGQSGGVYTVSGQPYVTWKFKNTAPGTFTKLEIQKFENGSPTPSDKSEYVWDSFVDSWTLSTGWVPATGKYSRKETILVSYPNQHSRTKTFIVKEDDVNQTVVSVRTKTYQTFPWGEELVQVVEDPDSAALTTTYTYYENTHFSEEYRYGSLQSVTYPDGSWEKYDYDEFFNLHSIMRPWKDLSMATATPANSHMTIYGYSNSDNGEFASHSFPRVEFDTEVQIAGVTVQKTRLNRSIVTVDPEPIIATAEASYKSSNEEGEPVDLITQTVTNRYHYVASPFLANRVESIVYPDGRKDSFTYEKGNYVPNADPALAQFIPDANGLAQRETLVHGTTAAPNGIAFKTTKTTSVLDQFGNRVLEETYVYNGSTYERIEWAVNTYDDRAHLTTTRDSKGQLVTAVWTNDKKTSEIDAKGIETTYTYDELNRVKTQTKKGIAAAGGFPAQDDVTTQFNYDAEGHAIVTTISSPSLSLSTEMEYDKAGRLRRSKDRAGLNTTYNYPNGGRTTAITRPGGATETKDNYLDGQTKSITGSAVVARYFDYGVNADGTEYTQEFTGNAGLSSPRWTKTTTDWVRRTVSVEKPSFTGTNVIEGSIYNSLDQLQKQTVMAGITRVVADKLFEYDELGNQIRAGSDVDLNGTLTLVSTDRISEADVVYEKVGNDWFRVTTSRTYLADNNSTPTVQSQRQRLNNFSLNGTDQAISEFSTTDLAGQITITTSTVDRAAKKQATVVDTPDSNVNAVSITVNGRLQSSLPNTPQSATTYLYDSLGRVISVTDPRKGTTTRAYSTTTGQLTSTNDGAGDTLYEYYPAGHVSAGMLKAQTNDAGKKTYFNYNSRGQVVQTWGDTTYPVENTYDSYGQRTELHTFRGGQNWTASVWPSTTTGATDVTKWIYHEATGLVTQKQDATLKGPVYTYDELGRLKTRLWARGITCTYGYDANTGELRTVTYSDSTPAVSFTYDRGGRQSNIIDAAGSQVRTFTTTDELQTEQITGGLLDSVSITVGYDSFLRRNFLQTSQGANTLSSQTYGYDSSSRLQTITSGSQTATYVYYPNSGLLNTTTFTGGANIARTYDSVGRLENITTAPASDVAQSYTFITNDLHQRTRVTREDGSYWAYTYNDRGELTDGKKYWSDNSIVWGAQTEFKYDNLGNLIHARNGGNQFGILRQSTYTSNSRNQYSQRTVPGAVDVTGIANTAATVTVNDQATARKSEYFYRELSVDNTSSPAYQQINIVGARNNFGAGGEDAVSEKGGRGFIPASVESFNYDDDGNPISDGRWNYTWDAENRLISIESIAGVPLEAKKRLEFAYDSMSRRIQKKTYDWNPGNSSYQLSSVTKFVYDGWNLMAELDANNSLIKNYSWGQDISGTIHNAGGIGGLLTVNEAGSSYQVGYDGAGNVTTLIHAGSGLIAASYEYDPFGNVLKSFGSYATQNRFQFSTKYTDSETGLLYFGHRYYNPLNGRFLNRDPKEEAGGINLYSYVGNNPTNLNDKLGLYVFRVLFDAFIHKNLGEWADEPGGTGAHFRTDFREFGEFDEKANEGTGNARMWSLLEVESKQIGKLKQGGVHRAITQAGMSHRRTKTNWFGPAVYSKPEAKRAEVKNAEPTIRDPAPCCSTVQFKPQSAYPFRSGPDIDYDVVFTLKILNEKEISVDITGTHDEFPYYEGQVNKDNVYKFDPGSSGPGLINLNSTADPIKAFTYILREK